MTVVKVPSVDWLRDRIAFEVLPGAAGRNESGFKFMSQSLDQHPLRHLKTLRELYVMALAIWSQRMDELHVSGMLPADDGERLWGYIAWRTDSALAVLRKERARRRMNAKRRRAGK